jgi:hypothetical protein
MEMLDRMQTGRLKVFASDRMVWRVPALSPQGRQDRERARRSNQRHEIRDHDETLCRYRAARVSATMPAWLPAAGWVNGRRRHSSEAREAFEQAAEAESDNRNDFISDLRFARLSEEQWPEKVKRDRETDFRPCLTINRMPSFIRQVVNDARQNKPSIKVPLRQQCRP